MVTDLKAHLSAWLEAVARGEEVVVADRGRPGVDGRSGRRRDLHHGRPSARQTLTFVLGGTALPPALYPSWLQGVVAWSPFRACGAIPTLIWLGRAGIGDLAAAAAWGTALTLLARTLTMAARRRVEVQGG